jgi:hypothetical protein
VVRGVAEAVGDESFPRQTNAATRPVATATVTTTAAILMTRERSVPVSPNNVLPKGSVRLRVANEHASSLDSNGPSQGSLVYDSAFE